MTEYYAPRSSQDFNLFPYNQHLAMPHYSNGNGLSYIYDHGQIPYQTVNTPCSTYSRTYAPSHGTIPATLYMPNASAHHFHYSLTGRIPATLPSQSRAYPMIPQYGPSSGHRTSSQHTRLGVLEYGPMDCTECQDSPNEATMLSEPILPPLEGYPNVHEFDELMKHYVLGLSPKKQDKALIHARRAANIRHVLIDKKTTSIESAQFRFWVKKMFSLEPKDGKTPDHMKKICHEGKPVAVREKLFKILTKAHKQCQHGGRDKTSAQVRKVYSWVPKELISRFVKLCPTCQVRRGTTGRRTTPDSSKSPEARKHVNSPGAFSRKNSLVSTSTSNPISLPLQTAGFKTSPTFQQQNRWMTPIQPQAGSGQISPASPHVPINHHDSYNTMPPMAMGCTTGTPPGVGYSSVGSYGTVIGAPANYPSSVSSSGSENSPTGPPHGIKPDPEYM